MPPRAGHRPGTGDAICGIIEEMRTVVLDTNVIVAALRSQRGASFELVSRIGRNQFQIALSVALVLEYEDALSRQLPDSPFDEKDVGDLLDYLCKVAHHQEVYYLWRPALHDPADDMLLELAVASRAESVVTFNRKHFSGCERFGIRVLTPKKFLEEIGDST